MVRDAKVGGFLTERGGRGTCTVGRHRARSVANDPAGSQAAPRPQQILLGATVEALAADHQALATADLDTRLTPGNWRLRARDWLLDRGISPLAGTGAGIDDEGRLVVSDAGGALAHISMGDVIQA
jgi:hypothetical protein